MAITFDATPVGMGRRLVAGTFGRLHTARTGKPYFVGLDQSIARAISDSRSASGANVVVITTRLEWGLGGHTLSFPYDRGDRRIKDDHLTERIHRILDAARRLSHGLV